MPNEANSIRELDALIKVGTMVNSHLELSQVLESIMTVTTEIMDVEASSLAIEDKTTGDLLFHVSKGDGSDVIEHIRMKRGEGIIGTVFTSSEPAIVNDTSQDERFCCKVDNESGFKTESILCVPLKTPKRTIGAIEVINKRDPAGFSDNDQLLCEAIAGQAAIAIENAMLHEEIVQNERMAAIGQTVAGLGHCIKNVLNGIQGGAYMVDFGIENEKPDKLNRGWEIVKKNNAFMQDLVLDMLNYSKEREPEYEETDINAIVEEVSNMIESKASEMGVDLSWSQNDLIKKVEIDPKGIRRCILNLASNGVDACETVTGEKAVRISMDNNGDSQFRIFIIDTGSGIPDESKKNLFKMFYSTKGSKGTGLGLAVTHKIIKEHGGSIDVESAIDQGTTFIITLPVKKIQQ